MRYLSFGFGYRLAHLLSCSGGLGKAVLTGVGLPDGHKKWTTAEKKEYHLAYTHFPVCKAAGMECEKGSEPTEWFVGEDGTTHAQCCNCLGAMDMENRAPSWGLLGSESRRSAVFCVLIKVRSVLLPALRVFVC